MPHICSLANKSGVYFIGVGGINMSSLAQITHENGYRTGGSDRVCTALTEKIAASGIKVNYNHNAENVESYDAVVYTVAISEDNPEYVRAGELGLPRISRADYLGYIMTGYTRRIGVSGMHGKSTCTSMCAEMLLHNRKEPTVLSGAELKSVGSAYYIGGREDFVFEACEYMDSFLDFNPNIAVVLNIEMDHVDYFKSMEQIRRSFAQYASLVGKDGYAVYNADDAEVVSALEGFEGERLSFGINQAAALRAVNITEDCGRYSFDILLYQKHFCHVDLRVSGYHNIYNALAATGACVLCGISAEDIARGLGGFCGACRRMEYKGSVNGAHVYDDYGHHPTEISATLRGAKGLAGNRLWCVYQPHTYSRTAALLDGFLGAFEDCDRVIFADIYAAREKNTYGISSELLASRLGEKGAYADSFESAANMLSSELRAGDVAVVMGAGDVYKVFDYLNFDE